MGYSYMSYGKTESVSLNENIGKIRITENLIVILTFNANSFAIAILVFFSYFPSRYFFWTDCRKIFSQRFKISYQERVLPRSVSFLGHIKKYFRKNFSSSCYSRCVWHITRQPAFTASKKAQETARKSEPN